MKRIHDTRLAARIELVGAGYTVAYSPPGKPELWIKLDDMSARCAIARVISGADETWRVMAYPEPEEDIGPVLSAGKLVDASVTIPDTASWLD